MQINCAKIRREPIFTMRNSISDIFGNLGDKATASARMEMISDICNNMPRELKSNARGSMIDKIRTMIRRRHDKKKLNTVKRILREPPRIYLTFPFSLPKREMPKEKEIVTKKMAAAIGPRSACGKYT